MHMYIHTVWVTMYVLVCAGMCVYVCVYVYVYMCVCVCVCIYVYICRYVARTGKLCNVPDAYLVTICLFFISFMNCVVSDIRD